MDDEDYIEELKKHIAELEAKLAAITACAEKFQAITEQALQERKETLAQLSQTWQPLPDDHYGKHDTISVMRTGTLLEINSAYGDGITKHNAMIELPDDLRLCRLVERAEPQPDWSTAPEWANWWTVDADGESMWYEKEPIRYETVTYCGWGASVIYGIEQGMKIGAGAIELPIGIDWRTTLRQRPTEIDK